MSATGKRKIVLASSLAFYPQHWLPFKEMIARHPLEGYVITWKRRNFPVVHSQRAWESITDNFRPKIYELEESENTNKVNRLHEYLDEIKPDIIWIQEEPVNFIALEILKKYFYSLRRPKIFCAVCENDFFRFDIPIKKRIKMKILWTRMNGVLPVADRSLKGIRAFGLGRRVASIQRAASCQQPPVEVIPFDFMRDFKKENDFIIGFCGRIVEQKGWQYLLAALQTLPGNFKCLVAGIGDQENELKETIADCGLESRVRYLGLLDAAGVYKLYKSIDCLILPSITLPKEPIEQLGGVLIEAMSMGVPVIGSTSGGIPETIGDAGLVVAERDSEGIAKAILKISESVDLRVELSKNGLKRFQSEYSTTAYSEKLFYFFTDKFERHNALAEE